MKKLILPFFVLCAAVTFSPSSVNAGVGGFLKKIMGMSDKQKRQTFRSERPIERMTRIPAPPPPPRPTVEHAPDLSKGLPLKWKCPVSNGDPSKDNIDWTLPYTLSGELDESSLRTWIERLPQDTNYFECIKRMLFTAESTAPRRQNELRALSGRVLMDYGQAAYKRGAMTPWEGGSSIRGRLSEPELRGCIDDIKLQCETGRCSTEALMSPEIADVFASVIPRFVHDTNLREICRARIERIIAESEMTLPPAETCSSAACAARDERTIEFIAKMIRLGTKVGIKPPNEYNWDYRLSSLWEPLLGETCEVLSPGHCQNVKSGEYRLCRDFRDPDLYKIEFGLEFTPAGDNPPTREEISKFKDDIRSCYRSADTYLKNGASRILLQWVDNPSTRTHKISVYSRLARESSNSWRPHTDCPTILHETMHLFGLHDEYPEPLSGYKMVGGKWENVSSGADVLEYNCRALGPKDSLMRSHDQAVSSVSKPKVTVRFCYCPDNGDWPDELPKGFKPLADCKKKVAAIRPGTKTCPIGLAEGSELYDARYAKVIYWSLWENFRHHPYILEQREYLQRDSLLPAVDFKLLTRPDCYRENKQYHQCTVRNAYVTEVTPFEVRGCNRPPECRVPEATWWESP